MSLTFFPSVRSQVIAFVRGSLAGNWDAVTQQTGLTPEEARQAAALFASHQESYDHWCQEISDASRAKGDVEKAADQAKLRCHLCESLMYSATCSCYSNYHAGYMSYARETPKELLTEWARLGGVWTDSGELAGSLDARGFAARAAYSNECRQCKRGFVVAVREVIKVVHVLESNPGMGTGMYEIRGYCPSCKPERRQKFEQRAAA